MPTQMLEFYDTLRDARQGEGINYRLEDLIELTCLSDSLGIPYIEGGCPNYMNPLDMEYYRRVKNLKLNAKIVAFGLTVKKDEDIEKDVNIKALLEADTEIITIVAKFSKKQVLEIIQTSLENNLKMITQTIEYLRSKGRQVFIDAEHYFDGLKEDQDYVQQCLKVVQNAGASRIVLCDTKGASADYNIEAGVNFAKNNTETPLGIHCHNDRGRAISNTAAAVKLGAYHIQGTINGFGERTGNANLCTLIPDFILHEGYGGIDRKCVANITSVSNKVYAIANIAPNKSNPYVGRNAFLHKGALHGAAVAIDPKSYEHIEPEFVGNERYEVLSLQAGRGSIKKKLLKLGLEVKNKLALSKIYEEMRKVCEEGVDFEIAEASFELMAMRIMNFYNEEFELLDYEIITGENRKAKATVKVQINSEIFFEASEGDGPVNALDRAFRKAVDKTGTALSSLQKVELIDYKVRNINGRTGTASKVRVFIEFSNGQKNWTTVGVSTDICEASKIALVDGYSYQILQDKMSD